MHLVLCRHARYDCDSTHVCWSESHALYLCASTLCPLRTPQQSCNSSHPSRRQSSIKTSSAEARAVACRASACGTCTEGDDPSSFFKEHKSKEILPILAADGETLVGGASVTAIGEIARCATLLAARAPAAALPSALPSGLPSAVPAASYRGLVPQCVQVVSAIKLRLSLTPSGVVWPMGSCW